MRCVPLALIACAAWSTSFAVDAQTREEVYPPSSAVIFAERSGSAVIGRVPPGAVLQVNGEVADGRIPVTIGGWAMAGAPTAVYAEVGQRIVQADFTLSAPAGRPGAGKSTSIFGVTWLPVVHSGWVDATAVVKQQALVWRAAKSLYDTRCSACHGLHPPGQFTANQWPGVVSFMAHNAALTPEEQSLITQYLQWHARGTK